ncbi:MAG: helix-turn-helix domain-containing protein [Chloroflexi bacterium]|nr:helix-turn-helix domain-containing protein [Chloroflexota bacterium]
MPRSPLGETLRTARIEKNITFEDAERVTRIPRKYLEALELENFGILPAPVYARGFLRSYASYLGLEPKDLLPFFPVGHVDEPVLESLPEVTEPRTWNPSSLIAIGVVVALIMLVVALYSLGSDSNPDFRTEGLPDTQSSDVLPGEGPAGGAQGQVSGPAIALPDLAGQTLEEAVAIIEETGATYLIVGTTEGDVPVGVVVAHDPGAGDTVGPGDLVTITVRQ